MPDGFLVSGGMGGGGKRFDGDEESPLNKVFVRKANEHGETKSLSLQHGQT